MDADLALAVTLLPGWRWRPGMLGIDDALGGRARVLVADETGVPVEWAFQGSLARQREGAPVLWQRVTAYGTPGWAYETWASFLPDLDDPATGGALLGMLGPNFVKLECVDDLDSGEPLFHVVYLDENGHLRVGPTEESIARACAEALVAVGRAGPCS